MKFSNILRGKRAERAVEVPGYTTADGKPFVVLARPLTGLEHEEAHAAARARAVDKGVADPRLGDPVYDIALMAHILAIGYVDPDSSPDARTFSFSSAEEVLKELHPEEIVYLHHRHEVWQDECSPISERMTDGNLLEKVREVAGPDGQATFMRLSPATQVNFAISTARTLLPLLEAKSSPGSSFDDSQKKPTSEPSVPDPETTKTGLEDE